jgi:hypothetical protein
MQASLSRSVIGSASSPGGGSKQIPADSARPMNQVGRAAGPRGSFIMVCVVGQIQGGDPSG